ncbi:LAMI_0G13652g1_1 [Lachancea mirantina]|uniref:Oleate activated transcription factor 3 n=1 Tax=Lachancea mirantina TaxID=1230905 RepID=A0A1G4KBS4_9SACH|nr:LAMI_0G13652g1_1 [Lachancea mirantina]
MSDNGCAPGTNPGGSKRYDRRKRRRLTIVCTNCKRRKSKCDKKKPVCGNCTRLGDEDTCVYVSHAESPNSNVPSVVSLSFENVDEIPVMNVDLAPNGNVVIAKRSATAYVKPLTTVGAAWRDPYLQVLNALCSVNKRHVRCRSAKSGELNGTEKSLPSSIESLKKIEQREPSDAARVEPEKLINRHRNMYKHLFTKFGEYRQNKSGKVNDKEIPGKHIPDQQTFETVIWPHFEVHVSPLCPIFENSILHHEIISLYRNLQKNSILNKKNNDNVIYAILLLITLLCQFSVNCAGKFNSDSSSRDDARITSINTRKYFAVVNYCLSQNKVYRKINLLQLQALLLLRFYHWCAPDEGDGEQLQQSNILMGAIIASCREVGAGWSCFKDGDKFTCDLLPDARPSPSVMHQGNYSQVYRKLWSTVLHWDRKLSMLTGQECFVSKSIKINLQDVDSWHLKMIPMDHLVFSICNLVSECPHQVHYEKVTSLLSDLSQNNKNVMDRDMCDYHQHFEMQLIILLMETSLHHACVVQSESTGNTYDFGCHMRSLEDKMKKLATLCHEYLFAEEELDVYGRFYTNKIVVIALETICCILPSSILRSRQTGSSQGNTRLLRFFYDVASMYFNEIGVDYYQCFKKLFVIKILYKTLLTADDAKPWKNILEFLVSDENEGNDPLDKMPAVASFLEFHKTRTDETDVCALWRQMFSCNLEMKFESDLTDSDFDLFVNDDYEDYNIFSAFCNNISTPFLNKMSLNGTYSMESLSSKVPKAGQWNDYDEFGFPLGTSDLLNFLNDDIYGQDNGKAFYELFLD